MVNQSRGSWDRMTGFSFMIILQEKAVHLVDYIRMHHIRMHGMILIR